MIPTTTQPGFLVVTLSYHVERGVEVPTYIDPLTDVQVYAREEDATERVTYLISLYQRQGYEYKSHEVTDKVVKYMVQRGEFRTKIHLVRSKIR